jgi:hypothetical protein
VLTNDRDCDINGFSVARCVKVALAVLVIFSVGYVLITPDPSDDVTSVLKSNHVTKARRLVDVALPRFEILVMVVLPLFRCETPSASGTHNFLDLVCVFRC